MATHRRRGSVRFLGVFIPLKFAFMISSFLVLVRSSQLLRLEVVTSLWPRCLLTSGSRVLHIQPETSLAHLQPPVPAMLFRERSGGLQTEAI